MSNRTNLIRVRVSDEEKKLIYKKAKEADLDMSGYIRNVLFNKGYLSDSKELKSIDVKIDC